MGRSTRIKWADHTFNIAWGCARVSEGCRNCYAEKIAKRRRVKWGPEAERLVLSDSNWQQPEVWNRAAQRDSVLRTVFCSSMADWAEDHPTINRERERLWPLIRRTPWLTWFLLTKRHENIERFLPDDWAWTAERKNYANCWLGVSVEDHATAVTRIAALDNVESSGSFASYEPALGPIDWNAARSRGPALIDCVDWVIYGGESGPNFRQDNSAWALATHDACRDYDVPFFYKQQADRQSGAIGEPAEFKAQQFPRFVRGLGKDAS